MIAVQDLYLKLLNAGLSLAVLASRPNTGSFWQESVLRGMGVKVAGPVSFGRRPLIRDPQRLELGRYVSVGANATISCYAPVSIGDDFLAADDLSINSGGHELHNLKPRNRPIHIGSRVWCGTRVTICAGVTVGDDAVIGAGAVVVRSVEPNTVVVGVPARPVRTVQREPGEMWSCFPERSSYHGYPHYGALRQLLIRLRQRL